MSAPTSQEFVHSASGLQWPVMCYNSFPVTYRKTLSLLPRECIGRSLKTWTTSACILAPWEESKWHKWISLSLQESASPGSAHHQSWAEARPRGCGHEAGTWSHFFLWSAEKMVLQSVDNLLHAKSSLASTELSLVPTYQQVFGLGLTIRTHWCNFQARPVCWTGFSNVGLWYVRERWEWCPLHQAASLLRA